MRKISAGCFKTVIAKRELDEDSAVSCKSERLISALQGTVALVWLFIAGGSAATPPVLTREVRL